VVYTLGRIPYGWLNEMRNLAPAFREEQNSMVFIRRFVIICGCISFGMMLVMFWSPLRDTVLERLIGVDAGLAARARVPLLIFSFYSFIVSVRAYTMASVCAIGAQAPWRPVRQPASSPFWRRWFPAESGVTGATLGIAALTVGFAVETAAVWWGVEGRPAYLAHRRAASSAYVRTSVD